MSNILNTVNKLLTPYNHTNGDVPRIKYIVIHYVGALGGAMTTISILITSWQLLVT